MKPELPRNPQEEIEARLTALLLGELSADEAAAVRRAIEQDGELAKLFARLHHTIGLVRETAATSSAPANAPVAPLKLSEERREKLLAQFKTLASKEFTPEKRAPKFRLIELAAVLVIVGLLTLVALPNFIKSRSMSQGNAIINNLRQLDGAKEQWALENNKSSEAVPTVDDLKPYLAGSKVPAVADETAVLGKVGEPSVAEVDASDAKRRFGRLPASGERAERVRLSSRGELAYVEKPTAETHQFTTGLTRQDASEIRLNLAPKPAVASPPVMPPPAQIILPATEPTPSARVNFGNELAFKDNSSLGINRGLNLNESAVNPNPGRPAATPEFGLAQNGIQNSDIGGVGHQAAITTPPVAAPLAQIILPAVEQPQSVGANDGNSVAFENNTVQGVSGSTLESTAGQAAGLPIVTTEAELAQNRDQNSKATSRFYSELNPKPSATSVPPTSGFAVAGPPPQVAEAVDNLALGEGVKNSAGPAYRRKYPEQKPAAKILREVVAGALGGGGADGLGSITTTNSVGSDNYTQWAHYTKPGANLQPSDGTLARNADQKDLLAVAFDGQPAPAPVPDAIVAVSDPSANASSYTVPTLGDLPAVGRLFTNSGRQGPWSTTASLASHRIAPEPNDSSPEAVVFTGVTTKPADSAGVAINESLGRPSTSIVLPGLATAVEARPSQVTTKGEKAASDSSLTEGKRSEEVLLAKAGNTEQRLGKSSSQVQESQAYFEKKRELEELTDTRRLLTRRMTAEGIDLSLPRNAQVEILERAEPKSAPSQTVWGTIRSAVSGDVERAARIKLERDKSDIADLRGKSSFNSYDPYFVQTEFEVIQSEAVLGKVVEQLKLDEAWATPKGAGAKLKTAEAIALLRGRLDLRPVPNTTLVDIRAKSAKPEEAARIANAVAEAYTQWRQEQGRQLSAGGMKALAQRSAEQDEQILRAQKELEALGQSAGIGADLPVRKPATNAPIPQPEVQTSENSFSTFSLNVSDVSFKLAAASLEQGQLPDAATVRSEEFLNAFDYRDPEPVGGAPIAFAYERARYSFAHNRDLLRFSLKTAAAGRQAGRPLNIVLLLDNSGSMERADRVQIIHEALRVLASQLQPQDKLSVITFARTARLVADGISGDQAGEVAGQVSGLTPQGGTNLEDAMNLAYQTAARHYLANGINRVVLLTDGAANLGDVEPESLKQKVEAQRKQGIALDCFGIGWEGFNDDLLEVLSRNGDGRYGFINSPEEAATEFAGQLAGAFKVAASDVKVQVEFNPQRVTAYRQIGYARHQLTQEQFRDNTVDAAEIAAQEAGNALYTVEVNPAGEGPLGTVRVRYKLPGTTDYREQAWDVPFTGNVLSLEQSSPAMRLAASASAFSEWLVASPFAGEVTPDALLGYLNGVPEIYGADARPKKLEWMIRQAKSVAGK